MGKNKNQSSEKRRKNSCRFSCHSSTHTINNDFSCPKKGLGVGESLSRTCRVCYGEDYKEERKSENGKSVVRKNVAFNMTRVNDEMNRL